MPAGKAAEERGSGSGPAGGRGASPARDGRERNRRTRGVSSSSVSSSSEGLSAGKAALETVASFASGCASGVLSAVILQPTDVLKTKMQGNVLLNGAQQQKTVLAVTRETIKQGGVRALWTGTKPAIVRVGLGIGVYMSVIEVMRKKFGEVEKGFTATGKGGDLPGGHQVNEEGKVRITPLNALATGACARVIATILVSPITVVKTRVEYFGAEPRKNFVQCVMKLAKKEGLGGLYRGVLPNIASSVPFSAIYYSLYTSMQDRLAQADRLRDQPPVVRNLISSSCAAVVATLTTQPADILRTQAQLDFSSNSALKNAQLLYSRCRELGFRTLFVGSGPRVTKRIFQAILVWTVYEELFRMTAVMRTKLTTTSDGEDGK